MSNLTLRSIPSPSIFRFPRSLYPCARVCFAFVYNHFFRWRAHCPRFAFLVIFSCGTDSRFSLMEIFLVSISITTLLRPGHKGSVVVAPLCSTPSLVSSMFGFLSFPHRSTISGLIIFLLFTFSAYFCYITYEICTRRTRMRLETISEAPLLNISGKCHFGAQVAPFLLRDRFVPVVS